MKLQGENCFLPQEEGEQLSDMVPGSVSTGLPSEEGCTVARRGLLSSPGGR